MEVIVNSPKTISYLAEEFASKYLKDIIQKRTDYYDDATISIIDTRELSGNRYLTVENMERIKRMDGDLKIVLFGYIYGRARIDTHYFEQYSQYVKLYQITEELEEEVYIRDKTNILASLIDDEILVIHYDIAKTPSPTIEIAKILLELEEIKTLTPEELKRRVEEGKRKVIREQLMKQMRIRKRALDRELSDISQEIGRYTAKLVNLGRKETDIMEQIDAMEKNELDEHAKEVLSILDLEKISDLEVYETFITIKTKLLYGRTKHDKIFKLAPYTVEIHGNGHIKFYCPEEYRRRSWWSDYDLHPHISSGGDACWGNLSSTIATLVSDREYKALVIMIINFLENINIDDVAGANCYNWDEVDEEGNVIKEGGQGSPSKCQICGRQPGSEYMYTCEGCQLEICDECRIELHDGTTRCVDCEDIVPCDVCDEYVLYENTTECENCGVNVCCDCSVYEHGFTFCSEECADEKYHSELAGVCTICDECVLYDNLYTCEECHEQICERCCVQGEDGVVRCSACVEEVLEDV